MSELKRKLDALANGPLLDSTVSIGRYLKADGVVPWEPSDDPVDNERLLRRRIAIRDAAARAAPLKARRSRKTKP